MSLPGPKEKGTENPIPETVVGPWAPRMLNEFRSENPKAAALPYTTFRGAAHANPKTEDPYHATARLSKDESSKGSSMTVHIYPDGQVSQSRKKHQPFRTNAATIEELGRELEFFEPAQPKPSSDSPGDADGARGIAHTGPTP
ncbi:hypothetical protein E4U19_004265 [Claviceps sp. Clav32 group G5]|nr:hypothetical protein E4U19_004265 [Claviceps sp. Clav32 group G5]KAG6043710.1 hypothetical protein E4U39_004227 [Claviceps sp. Clav50 group G5]